MEADFLGVWSNVVVVNKIALLYVSTIKSAPTVLMRPFLEIAA